MKRYRKPAWATLLLIAGLHPIRGQEPSSASGPPPSVPGAIASPAPVALPEVKSGPVPGTVVPALSSLAGMDEGTRALLKQMVDEAVKEREKENAAKPAALAPSTASPPKLQALWKSGIFFEDEKKNFSLHVGGTIQYDAAFYSADRNIEFGRGGVGPLNDAVSPRRMRFRTEGDIYRDFDFRLEIEMINGFIPPNGNGSNELIIPAITEAYFTFKNIPYLGSIRIGNQKEPFSFEHLISDRFISFMERSFLFDAISPSQPGLGFTPGIMLLNTLMDQRIQYAVGVFKNSRNVFGFNSGDGEYAVTGRLTGLPIYEDEGRTLLHVGVAGSHRDLATDLVGAPPNDIRAQANRQYRVRPSIREGPANLIALLANTGNLGGNSEDLYGAEVAGNLGSFSFRSEYQASVLNGLTVANRPRGSYFAQGYYCDLLYFLTGENSQYDKVNGVFTRDKPLRNFHPWSNDADDSGWGAFQLLARYNYIDLTNNGINGGVLHGLTGGLNWILNPNAKVMFNYDATRRSDNGGTANGWIHGFGTRIAVDF